MNKIAAGLFCLFFGHLYKGRFFSGGKKASLDSEAPFSPSPVALPVVRRRGRTQHRLSLVFGCLFSLSLKCCLTDRFIITALSLSIEIITLLLEELNHDRSSSLFFLSFLMLGLVSPLSSDSLQEDDSDAASRPAADWLKRAGVGCVAGGRE